jgi:hypothetical protein
MKADEKIIKEAVEKRKKIGENSMVDWDESDNPLFYNLNVSIEVLTKFGKTYTLKRENIGILDLKFLVTNLEKITSLIDLERLIDVEEKKEGDFLL